MPRLTNGLEQVLTNLGIVGSGYKLFFFETGTTTLKTTYSDEDLTVANTNPIVLNSAGRPSVDVWGSDTSLYRMILGTPDSVVGNITTIVDADPVDNYQIDNLSGLNPIPTAYWGATEGTSTAYTLEEPLVDISAYSNTQTFFVDFHIACGASPTLKVKDLAAITFKKYKGDGTTTDLVANDLQIQRYLCINNGTNIVVLNPEKPFFSGENIFQATTSTKGVSLLPQQITISNSTDSEHDLDFTVGNAQAINGSGVYRVEALTKRIDATWVAGTNQGGMDTGSPPTDAPIYCYTIQNLTTGVGDVLYTISAPNATTKAYTGANMPSGWGNEDYIGACHTDGSANIRQGTWTFGKGAYNFIFKDSISYSAVNPGISAVVIPVAAPADSKWLGYFACYDDSATNDTFGLITSIFQTDTAPSASAFNLLLQTNAGNNSASTVSPINIIVNSSKQLRYRLSISTIDHTVYVNSFGWQEYL